MFPARIDDAGIVDIGSRCGRLSLSGSQRSYIPGGAAFACLPRPANYAARLPLFTLTFTTDASMRNDVVKHISRITRETAEFRSSFFRGFFIYSLHTVDQIPRAAFYLNKDFADIFTDHP
jgi:hypothetical protein